MSNNDPTKQNVDEREPQDGAGPEQHVSETSIYVHKTTTTSTGQVSFSVSVDGRTYLIDGSVETAIERIREILDEME